MTVLDALVQATRERLQNGYYDQRPKDPPAHEAPSLSQTIQNHRPAVLAEVKPARPDGTQWSNDPTKQARAYHEGGAHGVSILTDPDHFNGHLANLQHAQTTGLPLLMKDFLIHEDQLHAAKAYGANAVLVIARLPREEYTPLTVHDAVKKAHELGLETLVEATTPHEMQTAIDAEPSLIGINQRDLDTLQHHPDRTKRLLQHHDAPCPVLHLSGIQTPHDVTLALQAGAQGVLVGTAAMDAPDPAGFIRSLTEAPT